MNVNHLINNAGQHISRNSSTILTAAGVTGVITTAYLAVKGAKKAENVLESEPPNLSAKEEALLTWHCYIPAALAGATTIAAILFSHKIETGKTAAAVGAYTITERAFTQYRDKVVEEIGKHKESVIHDDIAKERVDKSPPTESNIIVAGSGDVLCCELYTGRYFTSTMETLRKAQNDINREIANQLYVTLDTFYDLVKIPPTAHSCEIGWDSHDFMELKFSTIMSEDGRPCLAFDYNYVKPI